jgi:probable F420-dependent oxidoreductase
MKLGVVFPQTEFGSDPHAIRDFAQTAEGLGLSHVLAYDHVLGANPDRPGGWDGVYTHQDAFHEPFVLFGFMAAVTEKLEFATGIVILPQRQTVLVAKQAAALDVLSGGRLRLGVGLGWNAVEYEALGEDFGSRGRRIEEQIALMRRLWTEPLVEFSGTWHAVPDAGLNPMPVQRPIPVWFGGKADAALRRAARLGDGWMPLPREVAHAREQLDRLDGYLAEFGRTRAEFGIEPRIDYGGGDPDVWASEIEAWRAEGATHLSLVTMRAGFQSPAEHVAAMRRFAEALGLSQE